MLTCSVYKENDFIVPVTKKHPPFSPPLCAPLAHCAKILTREIWVRPTHARRRPVTGQHRAHTPPSVRTMSSYRGTDASL